MYSTPLVEAMSLQKRFQDSMGCKGERGKKSKDKTSCLLVNTFSLVHRILGCGNEFYSRDYFTGQDKLKHISS